MKQIKTELRSHCPVNYALEAIGDRWALLILRNIIFRGQHTFREFLRAEEGIASNILVTRLNHLIEAEILDYEGDESDGRKCNYFLTQKGLDLIPLIFEMVSWSEKYDKQSEAKRIMPLVELIRKNNRKVSEKTMQQVAQGEAIVREYLVKPVGTRVA